MDNPLFAVILVGVVIWAVVMVLGELRENQDM